MLIVAIPPIETFGQLPLAESPPSQGGGGGGGVGAQNKQNPEAPPPVVGGLGLLLAQTLSPVVQLIRAEEITSFKFILLVLGVFAVTSLHPEFPVSRLPFSHTVTLTPFIFIELMVSFGKPNDSPLM